MKAVFMNQHGGPDVLMFGDMPDPVARPGGVVDIAAASVNGADWKVRTGQAHPVSHFPYIRGRDFSGVIAAVGDGVVDLGPGDAVFGVCGQEGAYAEKIAVKAAIVARKPDTISHPQAAAIALTGLTALVAIEDMLVFKPGETILIQGGAGGVASFAIRARQVRRSAGDHHYERSQSRLRPGTRP